MTFYLDRDDLLAIASRINNGIPAVRDMGLLDAAIARPQSTVFGVDAYPTVLEKAAALLHSLARNHALIDGNKRAAWAAAWLFLGYNGIRLRREFDIDAAESLMNEVAAGAHDVATVATTLASFAA